jgi:hypothetical protein
VNCLDAWLVEQIEGETRNQDSLVGKSVVHAVFMHQRLEIKSTQATLTPAA